MISRDNNQDSAAAPHRKAVFLDRDGVLNHDPGHVHRIEDLQVLPGVAQALRQLQDAGFLLVVITNQGGVARGKYTLADAIGFNRALAAEIERQAGALISGFYICPHHPEGTVASFAIACDCRKPGVKLIEQAKAELGIDPVTSYFIGDRKSDVGCGLNAGMTAIQVRGERSFERHSEAAAYLKDLPEAATWILDRLQPKAARGP